MSDTASKTNLSQAAPAESVIITNIENSEAVVDDKRTPKQKKADAVREEAEKAARNEILAAEYGNVVLSRPDGSKILKHRVCKGSHPTSKNPCKFLSVLGGIHDFEDCRGLQHFAEQQAAAPVVREQPRKGKTEKKSIPSLSETNKEKYTQLVTFFSSILNDHNLAVEEDHCVLCAGFNHLWHCGVFGSRYSTTVVQWKSHRSEECGFWIFAIMCLNCLQTSVIAEHLRGILDVLHEGRDGNNLCTNCWCDGKPKQCSHAKLGCKHTPGKVVTVSDISRSVETNTKRSSKRSVEQQIADDKKEKKKTQALETSATTPSRGVVKMLGSVEQTKTWNKIATNTMETAKTPAAVQSSQVSAETVKTPSRSTAQSLPPPAPKKTKKEKTESLEPVPFVLDEEVDVPTTPAPTPGPLSIVELDLNSLTAEQLRFLISSKIFSNLKTVTK